MAWKVKMKKLQSKKTINVEISEVFKYFDQSLENLQKLDSRVLDNKLLNETDEKVGTTYQQKYQSGSSVLEYFEI